MAKVKHNPSAPQFSGSIRNLTYFTRNGKEFVRPKGERDSSLPFTGPQIANQTDFKGAVAYGARVTKDPERKAIYEFVARAENRDGYHRAISDALSAPVLLEINASGYSGEAAQSLTIKAKDDFEVASVLVEIRDPAGAVLEKGAAALSSKGSEDWVYTTTVAVPAPLTAVVIAVAIADRPGNKDVAQVDHLLRRAT